MRIAVGVVALALALAGCSSSGGTDDFPNPVNLIKTAGCSPDASTENGSLGFDGTFKVAECTYSSNMTIRVATFRSSDDMEAYVRVGQQQGPSDDTAVITVADPRAVVTLFATTNNAFYPLPKNVAEKLNGKVLG